MTTSTSLPNQERFAIPWATAVDRFLSRGPWLWVKVPVIALLSWLFFLPIGWKILLLGLTSVACVFVSPCPVGAGITERHLTIMFFSHLIVWTAVLSCVVWTFAYLQGPGAGRRTIGVLALLISPLALLVAGIGVGLAAQALGVPQQEVWSFLDRWTPIPSWRSSP